MWSSHSYKQQGIQAGKSEILLENSINQIESVFDICDRLPSLLTLKHLAERTNVSLEQLRSFVSRENKNAYAKFSIAKRSGGRRYINVPSVQLNIIQKWIHQHILSIVPNHKSSYAFIKGKSIKDCAAQHCGAQWLIKLDIINFFESISEVQVFRVFRKLGYQSLVSFELARLCTIETSIYSPRKRYINWHAFDSYNVISDYKQMLLGYLPQGASSSPLISNLVMMSCDEQLCNVARKYSLKYTRYSDDLTFSTRSSNFSRDKAEDVIKHVNEIISKQGFLLNFKKSKIIPPGAKKIVLGLNVDGELPRLQKEFKDKIRQHLYYLKKFGVLNHISNRGFDSVWGFQSYLRGLIDYAKMIELEYATKVLQEYNNIDWPF